MFCNTALWRTADVEGLSMRETVMPCRPRTKVWKERGLLGDNQRQGQRVSRLSRPRKDNRRLETKHRLVLQTYTNQLNY